MTRRTRQAGSAPRRRSLLVSSDDDDAEAEDKAAAAEKPKPQEDSPPPLAVTTRSRRSAEQAEQRTRRVSGEAAARAEALARLREARESGGSRPTRQPAQRPSRGAAAAAHDSDASYDEEDESEESEEAAGGESNSRSWSPARRPWQQLKSHLHKPEDKKRKFYEYRAKPVAGLRMERMSDDEAAPSDMDDFIAEDGDADEEEEEEDEEGSGGAAASSGEEAGGDSGGAAGAASDSDGPVVALRGTASGRGAKRRSRLVESSDDKEEEDDDDVPIARGKKGAAPKQPPSGSEESSSEDDDAPPKPTRGKQHTAVRRRKAVVTSSDDDAAEAAVQTKKRKIGKLRRVSGAAPEASQPQERSPRSTPRKKKSASQTAVQDALARLVAVQGTQATTGSQRLAEQLRATGALGEDEEGDEDDEEEEGAGDCARKRAVGKSSEDDESGGSGFIVYDDDSDKGAGGGDEAETDGHVACVCGATREDGDGLGGRTLVQCSNGTCRVWMHADCVGYAPKDDAAASAAWFCRRCEPAAKALLADSAQLPSIGFQPVGTIHEDVPPSEAARRAWQAVHGSREVGAALASVLATDSASALMALLDWSRPGAVKLALRRSGDKSILYRAAECGATRCCRALLRRPRGVQPSTAPAEALCAALQAGRPATVRALVQECPGIMALARKAGTYDAGGTAVHAASAGGSAECVGMSLSGLGDVACREALTAVDEELCTPLMLAAGSANHSALLHIINLLGTTYAADEAKRTDHNGQTAAHYAASAGVVQSIAALHVLHPPLLVARDSTGTAPLHLAAAEGHVAAVHELVRRGASVAAPDNAGWTPLLYANGDAALALLEHQPEAQLDALQVHLTESTTAEHRAMRLMRTLSESPGCFSVLNAYLRDRIYLLANRLSFFLRRPAVLDVVNKRKWLHYCVSQQRIAAAHSSINADELTEADLLWATREHPFTDSIQWLLAQRPQRLLLPIYPVLRFVESPHSFGAGVEREWLTLIAKQLSMSSTRMLAPTADGGRSLAPIPGALTATQQDNMHALGLLFAYCLIHDRTLPVPLEAPFLRCLLSRASTLTVDDLEAVDPVCWRSFKSLLEQSNVDAMGLTWELDGCELTPGGSNLAVTDTNKAAFVAAAAAWKLHGRIAPAVGAIRSGLNSVLSRETLAVLTDGDLGLLLGGVPTIDLADWRANTQYEGFSPGSAQIGWFWQCVTAMSPEERGLLLKLATGASAPPAGGFKELQGMGGPQAFTIQRVNAPAHHLPTASTCFNLLKIPGGYASYKDLERKLLAAVRFGSGGFEFV